MMTEEEQPTTAAALPPTPSKAAAPVKNEERSSKPSEDNDDDYEKEEKGQQTNDRTEEGADNNDKKHDDDNDDDDDDSAWKGPRDASKQLGDDAFRSGQYSEAIAHYTAAIDLDPDFAVAYSNRSACYLKVGAKSRALHDAEHCVQLQFGTKAYSRLAAALQSLKRWDVALVHWRRVLIDDPTNGAALQGREVCQSQLEQQQQQQEREREAASTHPVSSDPTSSANGNAADATKDELDDFFDEVDDATREVAHQRQEQLNALSDQPQATNAIQHHKKDLGTVQQQVDRLLQPNYAWRNLNPFYVLDLPYTATADEISRRYKALSLLLHPDKNPGARPRLQEAYDQVKTAKAHLDDEHRASHCRQLVEQGIKQGTMDWERHRGNSGTGSASATAATSLQDAQSRAVHKIFAQIEHRRREVEERERSHAQRERDHEEEEADKERTARTFDKSWKKDERVEKRIGSWRHFQKKKPKL